MTGPQRATGGPGPHLVTALPGHPREAPTARHGHPGTALPRRPDPTRIPDQMVTAYLDAADTCPCTRHTHGPCCVRRGLAAVLNQPRQHDPGT